MFGYLYTSDEQLIIYLDKTVQIDNAYDIVVWPIPPNPVAPTEGWDAPDNTPYQVWSVQYDDVDAIVIWPIPAIHYTPQINPTPASVQMVSKKPRYWIMRAAMMEALGVELPPPPPSVIDFTWDDVSESSILWLDKYKDHLSDEGVEIILSPEAYDTDADNQIPTPAWYLDYEEEREGVPFIILKPGIIRDWDADIGNMIPQPGWVNDYEDFDLYQFIPAVVIIVPIIYKLTATPLVDMEFTAHPEMSLYELSAVNRIKISQYTYTLSMSLYSLTVANRMKMQSFTVHGPQ